MRLIDADELIKKFKRLRYNDNSYIRTKLITETLHNLVPEVIAEQPTIEAEPVKRGKWIDVDYKTLEHGFIETYSDEGICCSECRTGFKKSRQSIRNFCPNCGARMRGDEK